MPAKAGKTPEHLKSNYSAFVGRMTGPKTKSCLAKVLSAGMTNAKEYAPIEYGTLINSAFRNISETPNGWRGVCGFTVYYALPLHGSDTYTPLWNPRPPEDKKGPAWNPFATPRFLELGFTGPLAVDEIQQIIASEYKTK